MHHEERRFGPRLQGDNENSAIASAFSRGQRSEQVDIGARLVRQRLAGSKVRFLTDGSGIVGSQEPGLPYRSCSSQRYAAPATMSS